ncbi:uncharacterized protein AB9X84_018994 [Acanthopagrus schlegelii]
MSSAPPTFLRHPPSIVRREFHPGWGRARRSLVVESLNTPPPYATISHSPHHTRSNSVYNFQAPMVEVAGSEGRVQLVYRPWTYSDMKDAAASLPDVRNGGADFAVQLITFCRQFKPTTAELQRLLMVQMGTTWARVAGDYPVEDIRVENSDWASDDNLVYKDVIGGLCYRIRQTFPLKLDMGKISACKQRDDELLADYLVRLTAVHTTHSGLAKPRVMGGIHEVTPWEAQLRDHFMNGMKPEISRMVREQCVNWDNANLETVEERANHAEKFLNDEKNRKATGLTERLQLAQLACYEHQARGRKRGR